MKKIKKQNERSKRSDSFKLFKRIHQVNDAASLVLRLHTSTLVKIKIFDLFKNFSSIILSKKLDKGKYEFLFDLSGKPKGAYFCSMDIGGKKITKNLCTIK